MTITLEEAITTPKSGRTRAVVLDFHEYAQSVILQGRDVPWHQPTAYSNFFGQAQGLLKPDVARYRGPVSVRYAPSTWATSSFQYSPKSKSPPSTRTS